MFRRGIESGGGGGIAVRAEQAFVFFGGEWSVFKWASRKP